MRRRLLSAIAMNVCNVLWKVNVQPPRPSFLFLALWVVVPQNGFLAMLLAVQYSWASNQPMKLHGD